MADPQLPDITAELQALPYPNEVKAQLFDAFYAEKKGKDEHVNAVLDRLDVPRELKNSLLDRRQRVVYPEVFKQTSAPPAAAKPQGPGVLERAGKNAPKSGANLIKGALSEATLLGPMERGAKQIQSVGQKTVEGYKSGGLPGAVNAGLEEGVSQVINPVIGAAQKIGHSLTSPLESFAEDPFGTVLDIVSVAVPLAKNARGIGSAVEGGVQALKGGKPGTATPPSSPGLMDRLGGAFKAAKDGFTGKPAEAPQPPTQAPQQNTSGPAAESARVFESGQKPVSREGLQKQQDLKAKIESKRTAPPPKIESGVVKYKQPKTESRFVADESGNMADTTTPPVYTPVESEIVEPQATRFYSGPGGTVDATARPVQPLTPQLPSAERPSLPQSQTKGLLPEASPNPGNIDIQALSSEYNVSPDSLYRFNQLDVPTLEHVASQADNMVQSMLKGDITDPSALQKASESSRAARAILQQKSYYMEGTRSPLEYSTKSAPIPGNNPDVSAAIPVKGVQAKVGSPTTTPPKSASRPPSTAAVDKPVPVDKPVSATTSKPTEIPKTAPPPKAAKSKFQTQPVPKPIQPPVATVTEVAPEVATVKSPVPQKLEAPAAPKKGEPVTNAQKTATRESEALKRRIGDKAKKIEPGKDGKVTYKNSKGEARTIPASDSMDLYEMNGETYALGTDPNHSNYGKLTSLDGKRTVMDVYGEESATATPEPAKAEVPKPSAPPKKKDPEVATPAKKSFESDMPKAQLDESPMKRHIRSLREKHGKEYKLTADDWKEARTLANEEESTQLSGKAEDVKAPVVTVKQLIGKLEHTVKVEGSGSTSRKISIDYRDPKSGRGSKSLDLVKEGDNVYLIDSKTRKRISSYPKMTIEEAVKAVTQ